VKAACEKHRRTKGTHKDTMGKGGNATKVEGERKNERKIERWGVLEGTKELF